MLPRKKNQTSHTSNDTTYLNVGVLLHVSVIVGGKLLMAVVADVILDRKYS